MTFYNSIGAIGMVEILYIISGLMLPALIWVIYSGFRVNTVFKKFNHIQAKSNLTGGEAARMILAKSGLRNVDVRPCQGHLSDHYDPNTNTVFLSESTFSSTTVGALGVAAHEVGHAIQYAKNYAPVKMRKVMVPLINLTSSLSMPLLFISLFLEIFVGTTVSNICLAIAIGFYALYMIFTLITLPVEYNASSRAKKLLMECGVVDGEEIGYVSKVLSAAAQTYLASFVFSFVQLCRMLLILISRKNNR